MIELQDKKECCGCKACGDACRVGAISFPVDNEGFWYPEVDAAKCVRCGRCLAVCPMLHRAELATNDPAAVRVYGGYHRDIVVRFASTSGGVFTALAQEAYRARGYVTGAIYTDDFQVKNVVSHKKSELARLRSSKYVQSDAAGLYREIERLVKAGEQVLACGSPCQMAALRSYLGRDYDNLVIVDFLCRACNSPKVFQAYLRDLEARYGSRVIAIKDKNKDHGWRSLARKITFENGAVYYGEGHEDDYRRGYHENYFERPSCYSCRFKGMPRLADITLADFWGVERVDPSIDGNLGTSMVLVNNARGARYLEQASSRLVLNEYPFDRATRGNHAIIFGGDLPLPPGYDRAVLFADLDKMSFSELAKKHFPYRGERRSRRALVKKIIKRILSIGRHPQRTVRSVMFHLLHGNVSGSLLSGKFIELYSDCALDIARSAKIELGGHLALGLKRNRKSHLETRLLLDPGARLQIGGGGIASGADIQVHRGGELVIGSCAINMGFQLVCQERIVMGDDVHIGRDVWIRDNNGGHTIVLKGSKNTAPVIIGDHVWICSNVSITKGVTIGDGAIISAGSVVSENVPAHTMVAGNPARVIAENVIWRP